LPNLINNIQVHTNQSLVPKQLKCNEKDHYIHFELGTFTTKLPHTNNHNFVYPSFHALDELLNFSFLISIHILLHNQQTYFYCMNYIHIHLRIIVVKKTTTIKYIDSLPFTCAQKSSQNENF
jgi:hypothetical protein